MEHSSTDTEHSDLQAAMIFEALNLLHPNGEVVELRILNTKNGTLSGYFDDFQALCKLAHQASGKVPTVYITLNPARKDLLARACNRIKTYVKTTTSDADIIRRRWLPIDVDPIRPKDISSTHEEHELALSKTYEIKTFLRSQGWPAPILGDSGNGGHLLYRIDLPNDNEASSLLRRCLEALDFLFSDEKVSIDRAVYNASRIWKLYGTMACKGENVPERPHRFSNILEVPTDMETVSREIIERIAEMLPETPKQEGGHADHHPFNLQEWISKHGISVAWQKPWQGGTAYILEECPFNPEHNRGEVCIIQFGSGALSFTCRHNSCRGYDWHALRDKFEPG